MNFDLVPVAKILFRARKKVAILMSVLITTLWVGLGLHIGFNDIWIITALFFVFAVFVWYPYVRYGKISQSMVKISTEGVDFIDVKNLCWRSIPYKSISSVTKATIYGTFYGEKKDEVNGMYICFFLNGIDRIPDVSYHKLFTHRNFAMITYQQEIVDMLRKCGIEVNENCN